MRGKRLTSSIAIILALGLIYSFGCIFDPKPDEGPDPGPQIEWPDLTQKEDVVEYMLLTYKHREYERYKDLLHLEYVWFLQPRDAKEYNTTSLSYSEDIDGTEKLFKKAVMLELEIDPGTWNEIQQVGEEPCPGCWETDRVYRIQAQLPNSDIIYMGNDHVKFIIVPVEEGGKTKYKIRWAYDIDFF
jgi:hypothetical protein